MVNKFGTTDDFADSDALSADNLLDTFGSLPFRPITNRAGGNNITGVVAHSATTYSVIEDDGDIFQTTDSGTTWTSRNTDLDTDSFIRLCKADAAYAFAIENATTAESAVTTNSGATWTTTTSATYGTAVYDLSVPTTSLIVVGGDDGGGGNHIIYSTDDGTTWNDASTQPSAAIYALDMFDGSTGYAIDSSGNIWKTTNSGVDWTDTTDNITGSATTTTGILALSATTCLIYNGLIQTYNNSTNTVTSVANIPTTNTCAGIVKTTNGDYYIATGASSGNTGITLAKSTDSGATWAVADIPFKGAAVDNTVLKCQLTEFGSNNLLVSGNTTTMLKVYNSD